MKFDEFRKTYAWTLKTYHGTHELFRADFESAIIGKVTIETYEKNNGKWNLVKTESDDCTSAFYFNSVDAIPFFRRLGGFERVSCGYCVRGYVPLEIISINPDRTKKQIRKFRLF